MAKKVNKEYAARNAAYLQNIAAEADTKALGMGVLCKILQSGQGDAAQNNSVVSVHYTGELISGHCFDSSRTNSYPETFRLRELIEGWQIALRAMRVGDRWKIYIPSELGYGDRTSGDIPGGSTLIFNVELLGVN